MRYKHGTEVQVTIRGTVFNDGGGKGTRDFHGGAQRVVDDGGLDHWVSFTPPGQDAGVDIEIIKAPAPEPEVGSVWQTADGHYFARISRRDLPLRLTPADQSNESGLGTLPVDQFFEQYPDAICTYTPSQMVLSVGESLVTAVYDDLGGQVQPGVPDSAKFVHRRFGGRRHRTPGGQGAFPASGAGVGYGGST